MSAKIVFHSVSVATKQVSKKCDVIQKDIPKLSKNGVMFVTMFCLFYQFCDQFSISSQFVYIAHNLIMKEKESNRCPGLL